ncbi:MAG: multiple antibiotic resistance (MarC)-related protein [Acidimicrobiaceae bacterium]|nr:multiple antibiotic resistance (MarC)-related protein [Acidimicrobiaceae bacterium]
MKFFFEVFVTLLVIMDPIGNVPVYLALTAGRPAKQRKRLAWQAVIVAGSVIAVFALFGQQILEYLGITVPALQGSGGLLLLLVALELLVDRERPPTEVGEVNVALVPLGTPLIAGPGAIAATIVFVRQAHGFHDALAIGAALAAVLVCILLALRFSLGVIHVLRPGGIHLLTRIFGLLLSAIAVQLIAQSVRGFIRLHGAGL